MLSPASSLRMLPRTISLTPSPPWINLGDHQKEIRHIYGPWSQMTRSQLRTILFAYIETFYNRARHQARLGRCTPAHVYADHAA